MRRRTRIFLWISGIFVVGCLVLVLFLFWVIAGILQPQSLPPPKYVFETVDFATAIEKVQLQLADALNTQTDERMTLELSLNEVNALLYYVSQQVSMNMNQGQEKPLNSMFVFCDEEGVYRCTFSRYLKNPLPFGNYINANAVFSFAVEKGKWDTNLILLTLGDYEIPQKYVRKKVDGFLKNGISTPSTNLGREVTTLIEDLSFAKGRLRVVYRPDILRSLIFKVMERIQTRPGETMEMLPDASSVEPHPNPMDQPGPVRSKKSNRSISD